jgi:amino acid permease
MTYLSVQYTASLFQSGNASSMFLRNFSNDLLDYIMCLCVLFNEAARSRGCGLDVFFSLIYFCLLCSLFFVGQIVVLLITDELRRIRKETML